MPHDLLRRPTRRTFLTWLTAAPLVPRVLAGCGDDGAGAATDTVTADTVAADTVAADSAQPPDALTDGGADIGPTTCEPTQADLEGPFFEPNAPTATDLAPAGEPGDRLAISGRVLDPDCQPIPGAVVEVWQADADGDYHDDKLRAVLTADGEGRYAFSSVVPGRYFQANGFRPAHLHYKVRASGFRAVTTQIYFEGDPYLSPNDSCGVCASDDGDRIIPLVADRAGVRVGAYDPVLAPA